MSNSEPLATYNFKKYYYEYIQRTIHDNAVILEKSVIYVYKKIFNNDIKELIYTDINELEDVDLSVEFESGEECNKEERKNERFQEMIDELIGCSSPC